MDFENYLNNTAKQIEDELNSFFKSWIKEVKDISPDLVPLANTLAKHCGGGKRLRGVLVKLGYEMAKSKQTPDVSKLTSGVLAREILKPAIAYEIFQTAILAHDDVIDLSDLRRGKPSMYKELGGDHYGISQTICLGDAGFFLASLIISQSNFPAEEKNKALTSFSKTIIETALGEILDVEVPHLNRPKTEADALTISHLKTARYTFVGPFDLGATLGGADQTLLDNLKEFGDKLGIGFQIQDDILGVFGDEKTLGKSVTSDIEEGKNTLLITQAQKKASSEQREVLNKYYGKGKIGESELSAIRKVFKDTGSLDYSRQVALKYVTTAKAVIPKITKEPKYSQLLSQMADFLVERDR